MNSDINVNRIRLASVPDAHADGNLWAVEGEQCIVGFGAVKGKVVAYQGIPPLPAFK